MRKMAPQEEISRPDKRMKHASVDFLSELSDDLLLCILNHLPANEAVRSSSLSHRWRHLPSLLPVRPRLRLAIRAPGPPFIYDLEAIQRGLRSETSLLTACEIIPDEKPSTEDIASWSNSLLRCGVRELFINFWRTCRAWDDGPDASYIVRCKSLVRLKLYQCSLLQKIQVGCIFLTHVHFETVKMSNEMVLGFASRCKSLNSLKLIRCYGFKCFRLEDARRLKSLTFHCPRGSARDVVERMEIEAPNLEELELRMRAPKEGIDLVAPMLRRVYISLSRVQRRYYRWTAPGLWKGIFGAGELSWLKLRDYAVDCLSQACTMPDGLNSPFLNLKRLYINLVLNRSPQALCLAIFLQNFSMLEQLNIVIVRGDLLSPWESARKSVFKEHEWRLEESICIRNRLRQVRISGFMGKSYEMDLARFILTRAKALKKMTISLNMMCTDEGKMRAKSLTRLAKASPKARLLITRGSVVLKP